ncbi:hypothetical protein Tco_0818957 [Tanacetum coccineum]
MRLEAAKGDSRWDALVISPRDGYFDPMEFYSAPSSEPRGEDDAVASPNAFNASSVPVDSVLSADFWFHPRILPSVRKATDAAKSADGLSSVISIDLADQVFEGIGARQLVVKKEPAFFNPPEEKVLLYTHRGELPGKLLKDEELGKRAKGMDFIGQEQGQGTLMDSYSTFKDSSNGMDYDRQRAYTANLLPKSEAVSISFSLQDF